MATETKQKLLNAGLALFRKQGYNDTTVDDLCRAAGVTKGSFFHYFSSKEVLALAAIEHWNQSTGSIFATAPYHQIADSRERLLAYIDFRGELIQGEVSEFTCLLGTLVQETFSTHPQLREACAQGIALHAQAVTLMIEAAREQYAPEAEWTASGLAIHTQAVLQGAFILAKAWNQKEIAIAAVAHLRNYVEQLLPIPEETQQ